MGVSAGQAGRVDDMVVGEKVEDKDKDEKGETAEEEKEEENVKEDQAKETEEDKDDKENEGTEDTAGEAELELSRLKELVPSVCIKDNVSQLDVILEAIRYIASLQGRLADKIESGEVVPLMVPMVSTSNKEDMKSVEEKEEGEGN